MSPGLAAIPLVDVAEGGALALLHAERTRADALLKAGYRRHGRPVLRIGDRLSEAWLARAGNPYLDEIRAVARALGGPGAVMLNLSFEWSCTSGTSPVPSGRSNRMLRVLDWPMDGLGRNVVVARQSGPAGAFYNVTWPGATGVLTAMAPGRFAAAINQAPMRQHGLTRVGDWARNRMGVWHSRAWPPAHWLRRVFETAPDYDAARRMLCAEPLVLPCLFILSGRRPEQGCVIERLEDRAIVHESPVCVANAWLTPGLGGRPRGRDNAARRGHMATVQMAAAEGFEWLVPPMLNHRTRLAVMADAGAGRLDVVGIEQGRPATLEFQWVH